MTLTGRDGLWLPEFALGGSNLREGTNMVNHLLKDVRAGKHDGCEVWCFTDNAVWSYVWNSGLSTAKHLFQLVLDLRIEARKHEVYIRSCHISGNKMIATGMDGWSRGIMMRAFHLDMISESTFLCTRMHGALLEVHWRVGVEVGWDWTTRSR